jgi:asparagine synthase (glutamine-hydrolysing)
MCGISGFFSRNKSLSKDQLISMTRCLTHRGPDAEGYFFEDGVGMGHRRLSIIDLSTAANQPMYSQSGKFVIIFNGEIYNFKELAVKWGLSLRTSSDTEVLIEGFEKFGPGFVNDLNGMFAIAIYDLESKELYIFRDRLGVKPVYYYWDKNNFIFGSEIKSIANLNQLSGRNSLNKEAIMQFLHLGYIPEGNTIFQNIKKFPSGSFLKMSQNKFEISRYWDMEGKISKEVCSDLPTAKRDLTALLQSSIEYRMISDVPFGIFLSGGIDSSLVTAIAQSLSQKPLKTFSIGFNEKKFNEAVFAKEIASYLKTEHYEFYISEKDGVELFEEVMDHYDEPFADTSAIPTYIVSKLARKHVKMVLTGDGGDELFMGYGSYQWAKRLSYPTIHSLRKSIALGLSLIPSDRFKKASHLFDYKSVEKVKSHIFSQEQGFFSEREIKALVLENHLGELELDETLIGMQRKLSRQEEQALFDIKYYLKDDLLVKVDKASMLASLEAREPLLDYRIVEFSLNIAESLKINNGISKYLLKQVLYDYVPSKYFDRPKWGFSIPISSWLKGDLKHLIDKFLSKENIELGGFLKFNEVNNLKERFLKGENHLFKRILALILIQKWLIKYDLS